MGKRKMKFKVTTVQVKDTKPKYTGVSGTTIPVTYDEASPIPPGYLGVIDFDMAPSLSIVVNPVSVDGSIVVESSGAVVGCPCGDCVRARREHAAQDDDTSRGVDGAEKALRSRYPRYSR